MTKKQDRSGKQSFLLLLSIFALLALAVLWAGWYYYQGQVKSQRLRMEHQLAAIADIKVQDITRWKKERFGEANVLFGHLTFSSLVRRFLENPEDARLKKELWGWLHQVRIGQDFESIFLLDARARVRLTVPESPIPLYQTLKQQVSETLRSPKVTLVDIHREGPDRPTYLGMLMPIVDPTGDGRPLAVLVMRIDPESYLYPFLKRWPTLNRTAETQLVRREGKGVVFLNELRYQKNAVLNLRLPLDRKEIPAVQAALGREGVFEGKAIRGKPILSALRAIPETPWKIVVKLDLEEVYAPLQERLWITVVMVGLLILGLGAGLGLTWRHQRSLFYKEKYLAAEALRESEDRFHRILMNLEEGYYRATMDGVLLEHNPSFNRFLGFDPGEDLKGTRLLDFWRKPEDRQAYIKLLNEQGFVRNYLIQSRNRYGEDMVIMANSRLLKDEQGRAEAIEGTVLDYTDLYRAEENLKRMNRLFGALSQVNQVVVRTRSREDLFAAVCRVIVKFGDFKLAWVGRVLPQENRLEVSSWDGQGGGFLDGLTIPCQDPQGRFGPLVPALNSGRTFVSTDFQNTVFEEASREVGFRAMAAMPLKRGGEVVGVLVIHEEAHDFFRLKETDLLEEVAGDISFALDHLAEEEARRRMEEELRRSEERYRDLVEHSMDLICTHDLQGNLLSFNETAVRMSGYSREQLRRMNIKDLLDPEVQTLFDLYLEHIRKEGKAQGIMRTRNVRGELRLLDFQNTLKTDIQPPIVRGTAHDITDRFQAEEKMQETLVRLRRAMETTIRVMAGAVEARDPYTAGHQKRTTVLTEAIAREMEWDQDRIDGLRLASSIHDIGKLSIPAEILSKPTTLSNIEFALIKTHAQYGFDLLRDVESPWPLADILLQHHERIDGSGYPQGLKGDEILLQARILAVADVVEAISSHRPYRPAFGIDIALEEIEKQKGILFDPQVVEVCLRLFREKGFGFE